MSLTSTQQGSFSVTQDKTEGTDPRTKSSKYMQERCNATDVIFPHTLFFHAPHLSTHFLSEKSESTQCHTVIGPQSSLGVGQKMLMWDR